MARIITISGGRTVPRGKAEATRSLASKVDKRHQIGADDWVETGRWVRVKSSWAVGIQYDKDARRLSVEFKDGAICRYVKNFTAGFAMRFFNAPSIGKFIHAHLYDEPYE